MHANGGAVEFGAVLAGRAAQRRSSPPPPIWGRRAERTIRQTWSRRWRPQAGAIAPVVSVASTTWASASSPPFQVSPQRYFALRQAGSEPSRRARSYRFCRPPRAPTTWVKAWLANQSWASTAARRQPLRLSSSAQGCGGGALGASAALLGCARRRWRGARALAG